PGEDKPGVFRLRGMYEVEANDRAFEPVVLFPLPLSWGPQVPLSWEVRSNPSAMVRTWRVYERKPHDWVAEVRFPSLEKGDKFALEWEAYVLCGPSAPPALPAGVGLDRLKEAPEEARPWLASTRCVQRKHERFKSMAKELREGAKDVAGLVEGIQARLADIYARQEGQARDLSALEALDKPGSCTSCANVTAGVYRACGVPARVLSGYPVWSGPLQTHYIVEIWLPDTGWYAVESTMLKHPWPQSQQLAVSLVYPEDEDGSAGRSCAADGVPYLSLTEAPGSDGRFTMKGVIPGREWCDHEAAPVRAFPKDDAAWDEALTLARRHWRAWLAQGSEGPLSPDAFASRRPLGQAESLAELLLSLERLTVK
ncbi:MAG: transglutaminase-like domain-containing protein, partial [Planctomycetota bacterium]